MNKQQKHQTFLYTDEEVDSELECQLCCQPLFNPVIHSTCLNMYCADCFLKSDTCPSCNEDDKLISNTIPRIIMERLENLNVLCPYCNDEVMRGRYNLHIANCPEVPFECKSALCSWKGKQSELSEHTSQCPFVVIQPLLVEMAQKINMQSQYIKQLESKVVALSANQQALNNVQLSPAQVADCVAKVLASARLSSYQSLKLLINKTKASFHTPLTPRTSAVVKLLEERKVIKVVGKQVQVLV